MHCPAQHAAPWYSLQIALARRVNSCCCLLSLLSCPDTCPTAWSAQYKENMEMRMKHADAPERFMDSEVDLDEVRPTNSFVTRYRYIRYRLIC